MVGAKIFFGQNIGLVQRIAIRVVPQQICHMRIIDMQFIYLIYKPFDFSMMCFGPGGCFFGAGVEKFGGTGARKEAVTDKAFSLGGMRRVSAGNIIVKVIEGTDGLLCSKGVPEVIDNEIVSGIRVVVDNAAVSHDIAQPVVGPEVNVFFQPFGKLGGDWHTSGGGNSSS